MPVDWQSLLTLPTPDILRGRKIPDGEGAGILWSVDESGSLELSALGVIAWEGHEEKPAGSRYEWAGANLLCNAAPTPFVLGGETFHSIDSFHEALKIPEGTSERAACAMSPLHEAKRTARRYHAADFVYRGERITVRSPQHESLLAAAICAKIEQHSEVQSALHKTGTARLVFPLTFAGDPGALARATPLTLMIERWKRSRSGRR